MKNKPVAELLNSSRSASLHAVVDDIVRIADPEKILLVSAGFGWLNTENLLLQKPVESFRFNFYELLILTNFPEQTTAENLRRKSLRRLADRNNFQFSLFDIHEFNKEVESGNEYAIQILLHAMISYDREQIPFSIPATGRN